MDIPSVVPTKYALEIVPRNGKEYARLTLYHTRGFSAVEFVELRTGKSLPGLRKDGAKLAKRNKVTFEDLTNGR